MTGTMISYLACGPGHSVSVGLRAVEVVGVLLPLAGLVSLVIGLTQRFAAAKQPPPPFPGYPAGPPPGPPPGPKRPGERRSSGSAWRWLSLGRCASCRSCRCCRVSYISNQTPARTDAGRSGAARASLARTAITRPCDNCRDAEPAVVLARRDRADRNSGWLLVQQGAAATPENVAARNDFRNWPAAADDRGSAAV